MKHFFLVVAVSVMAVAADAQKKKAAPAAKPKAAAAGKTNAADAISLVTPMDSFSYAVGLNIGNNLKQQHLDGVNPDIMLKAMKDVFSGKAAQLNDMQANSCIQATMQAQNAKKMAEDSKKAVVEKQKSARFLEENKKKTGVISLPNGLQYEVIKSGDPNSVMPQLQDTVVAHYAGSLIDGKEFDNSYKRGEPLTIPVGGVIRGWTEILQKMHIGDKWKVYIPSELGYGDRGAGADIPGGAALIFEMELLEVKKAGGTQQPAASQPQEEKKN